MSTWAFTDLSDQGVAEVDFLFSDGADFLFSDATDFLFLEGTNVTTWTAPTKNTATYSFETKN